MRHPRRRSRTHPRGFLSMQRSDDACRLLIAALLVYEDILMAYDRSLIVADPRRCEPKKFGGARVRTEWSTDWWDLICFSECIPVKGIRHRTSLSKNTSSLCPAQVALPVPASRSLTDEQLKPIAVILVTPRGKCLEVDSYKRLREKKCRSRTLRVSMHLRDLAERGAFVGESFLFEGIQVRDSWLIFYFPYFPQCMLACQCTQEFWQYREIGLGTDTFEFWWICWWQSHWIGCHFKRSR